MPREKRRIPQLATLPPSEEDLQELLYRFEEAVFNGAPLAFATLRELWKEMQLSFIFETRHLSFTHEDFVQSLFASALDCLEIDLRPRRQQPQPVSLPDILHDPEANQPIPQPRATGPGPTNAGLLPDLATQQPSSAGVHPNSLASISPDLTGTGLASHSLPHTASTIDFQNSQHGGISGLVEDPETLPDLQPQANSLPGPLHAQPSHAEMLFSKAPNLSIEDLIASSSEDEMTQNTMDEDAHLARVLESLNGAKKKKPKASKAPPADPEFGPGNPAWDLLNELPSLADHLNEDLLLDPIPQDLPFNEHTYNRDPAVQLHQQPQSLPLAPEYRLPDPHVVRVGAVFLLYAIYKAQPGTKKVKIYVALHLLKGLTWMCSQSPEAAYVLRALWKEDAFVVGAVRRPISGSKEAREAGRSVKSVVNPDQMEQYRITKSALIQLNDTSTAMGSLQHIQLLCNSYKAAQQRLWKGRTDVQGPFDLELGLKLGRIVTNMRNDLVSVLQRKGKDKAGASTSAAPASQEKLKEGETDAFTEASRAERDKVESGNGAVETSEQTEARRRQRAAISQDDDDMPTFARPCRIPGLASYDDVSDSEIQQLPKAARKAMEQQKVEIVSARAALASWEDALPGLTPAAEAAQPAAQAARGAAAEQDQPASLAARATALEPQAEGTLEEKKQQGKRDFAEMMGKPQQGNGEGSHHAEPAHVLLGASQAAETALETVADDREGNARLKIRKTEGTRAGPESEPSAIPLDLIDGLSDCLDVPELELKPKGNTRRKKARPGKKGTDDLGNLEELLPNAIRSRKRGRAPKNSREPAASSNVPLPKVFYPKQSQPGSEQPKTTAVHPETVQSELNHNKQPVSTSEGREDQCERKPADPAQNKKPAERRQVSNDRDQSIDTNEERFMSDSSQLEVVPGQTDTAKALEHEENTIKDEPDGNEEAKNAAQKLADALKDVDDLLAGL